MTDIRRGDDTGRRLQRSDLRRQNDVAAERLVVGCRSSLLASFSPECRRLTHRGRRQRHIFNQGRECIESSHSRPSTATGYHESNQQLAAHRRRSRSARPHRRGARLMDSGESTRVYLHNSPPDASCWTCSSLGTASTRLTTKRTIRATVHPRPPAVSVPPTIRVCSMALMQLLATTTPFFPPECGYQRVIADCQDACPSARCTTRQVAAASRDDSSLAMRGRR